METTNSTKILFRIFYGEKPNNVGSLSEFGRIVYATKRDKLIDRQRTIPTRQSFLDTQKTTQEILTSYIIQKKG